MIVMGQLLNDTVPPEHMNLYGSTVNTGFGVGIFVSNFMGLMLPSYKEEKAILK